MAKTNNNPNAQDGAEIQPETVPQPTIMLTRDALIELIREARRDPALEQKLQAEADRVQRRRVQMVRIAKADEASRIARQAACRHRKPNNEETSGGQTFSDGRVRIFCLRCQKVLREYWAPEVAQGMAIAKKMDELGLTEDDIKAAMEFKGEGDPAFDAQDDFALSVPRGVGRASLTT